MITLYGIGEGFGLPEISPFVTKTEVQLKMAGLGYEKVRGLPFEAPKGQLPFIDSDGVRIGWIMIQGRWLVAGNFAKGPSHFFDGAPEGMREGALEGMRQAVQAVGVGRHSELETLALGVRSLAALSAVLGDQRYLFGRRPCGADATVFAMLAAILTPYFENELRRRAEGFGNLVDYVDRLMAEFYPGFDWDLAARVGAPAMA